MLAAVLDEAHCAELIAERRVEPARPDGGQLSRVADEDHGGIAEPARFTQATFHQIGADAAVTAVGRDRDGWRAALGGA